MINAPRSSPDDHYFCCFFFCFKEYSIVCWILILYPWIFNFPDNWWIIYIPWLSSGWKMFSDFSRLFQFSLTWTNLGPSLLFQYLKGDLTSAKYPFGFGENGSHTHCCIDRANKEVIFSLFQAFNLGSNYSGVFKIWLLLFCTGHSIVCVCLLLQSWCAFCVELKSCFGVIQLDRYYRSITTTITNFRHLRVL